MTAAELSQAATELARVAAPIYAQRSGLMRERDAMETAVRDAAVLVGVASYIIERTADVRRSDV